MPLNEIEDIQSLLKSGKKLVVEFGPNILDAGAYPEPGMRAKVIAYSQLEPDLAHITFDYAAFDSHNKALESSNYFDGKRVPCLTAREAGFYKEVEGIYFTPSDEIGPWFRVLSDDTLSLYAQYKAEVSNEAELPYVSWLEQKAIAPAPKGWQLVPQEPTTEMLSCFHAQMAEWLAEKGEDKDVYQAMLAAAPALKAEPS